MTNENIPILLSTLRTLKNGNGYSDCKDETKWKYRVNTNNKWERFVFFFKKKKKKGVTPVTIGRQKAEK